MSLAEAQARIGAREYAEWAAFYSLEPRGDERLGIEMAHLACIMANIWRGKDTKPISINDLRLRFEPKEPVAPEALSVKLRAWANAHNAAVRAKHGNNRKPRS